MTRTTSELALSSPSFRTTPGGGLLSTMSIRPTYTSDLLWNRDSNLESSVPKAGTLPLSYGGPVSCNKIYSMVHSVFRLHCRLNWKQYEYGVDCSIDHTNILFPAPYTSNLQWNRVSNLVPCGPKAETLPPGHRGLDDYGEGGEVNDLVI
ncbi:hypothetical protein AVEN_76863-1 [Araneus ventricosus]|uniref:Uncharacterized protein n=1 Tax=Araneus ventricosus TaxID=182803 RepID=A0A4Y2KWQ7_ARAVE|nr:hypothetical protein AVEN_76863-1 [Araneus ventricosus]